MTAETFLLSLRRFIARRGSPKLIISDNGSQLKLGSMVVSKLWKNVTNDVGVQSYISDKGISWKYTVEYSPWKGGFYERLVKTVKISLRKQLGSVTLDQFEFGTILTEAEAIVNSRPLLYIGDDINSSYALTPAHFLSVNSKKGSPDCEKDTNFNEVSAAKILASWKKGNVHLDSFWKIWLNEYLQLLRERKIFEMKHVKGEVVRSPYPGEIVLVKELGLKRGRWKLARVESLISGSVDNVERAARLLTKGGLMINRPFSHLYPLELNDNLQKENTENVINENDKTDPLQSKPSIATENEINKNNECSSIQNRQIMEKPKRNAAIKAKDNIRQWVFDSKI